jgi:hypothetical protein
MAPTYLIPAGRRMVSRSGSVQKPPSRLQQQQNADLKEVEVFQPPVNCCLQRCGEVVPVKGSRSIRRRILRGRTQMHRKSTLLSYLSDSGDQTWDGPAKAIEVCVILVCPKYPLDVTTVSSGLLNSVLGTSRAPSSAAPNRKPHNQSNTNRALVLSFLLDLKQNESDRSTDKECFHLPQVNKIDIVAIYKARETHFGRKPSSHTCFVHVLKGSVPEIKQTAPWLCTPRRMRRLRGGSSRRIHCLAESCNRDVPEKVPHLGQCLGSVYYWKRDESQ